jgi:AraC-like DNA-binding protein
LRRSHIRHFVSQFLSHLFTVNVADFSMNHLDSIPPLHGAVITDVVLVDRIERRSTGAFRSESLPGHLLHVVVAGEVRQQSGGVIQDFGAGHAIWYWENEPVQGTVLKAPWVFFTVNFLAPTLPPPPLDQRVRKVGAPTVRRMEELLSAWRDAGQAPMVRHLRAQALLLQIVADLLPAEARTQRIDRSTSMWWKVESKLRSHLAEPIDLTKISRLAACSQSRIIRACHLATGMPPMKRLKQLRLGYARGLVQLSDLSMSEIAFRIAYSRVHEFSRDYRKHFGLTPTQDRRQGPDYHRRQ